MPEIEDLADILVGSRVATRDQWERAAQIGGGDLAHTLDALADGPPEWWDGTPPTPPGLTTYQRSAIELRFEMDEIDRLHRDLALNRFLLLEKLGQGGQGEVYRGRQLNPPRFAAVKTLVRDTEVRRRRFEQEARTMMRVQHPAVARFYLYERVRDAEGVPTDEYLIAMEFVDGTPLHRLVRRSGPVPWPFAVRWVTDLLGGLAVIHDSGLIHRDVKPENVMVVGPDPGPGVAPGATAVKLLDFGAVKRADAGGGDGVTAAKIFIGTVEYAPPEQWTSEAVAASDLYALGGTLFFMLTGQTPFQKDRRDVAAYRDSHLHDEVPDLRQRARDVPAGVNRLFRKMMAKDPAARGTAAELLDEFRRLRPGASGAAAPPSSGARSRPAPAPKSPTPTPPTREPVARHPLDRTVGPAVAVLERVFLPAHHRPTSGAEPPLSERLAALLRRPLVLLLLIATLLGLLVLLIH
jgi:serine/threonine protein kinase